MTIEDIRTNGFASPWSGSTNYQTNISAAVTNEDALRPSTTGNGSLRPFVSTNINDVSDGQGVPDYSALISVPEDTGDINAVIQNTVEYLFDGMNNPQHPMFQGNVLPPSATASIVGALTGMNLMPNIIDEHYSVNVAKAEIELGTMIANMVGWEPWTPPAPTSSPVAFEKGLDPAQAVGTASGIVTFGGTSCYLYALKHALTTMVPNSRNTGIPNDEFVIMVSNQGHYCYQNTSDWAGLGMDNVRLVRTNENNNRMDTDHLQTLMDQATADEKAVAAVIATFGTTDAGALDDIATIRNIVDSHANYNDYPTPYLYGDSVIGWVFLFWSDYDFVGNPLGFDPAVLATIETNAALAQNLSLCDAFGCDFHKTGFSHYPSTMVMFQDYVNFANALQRPPSPYLQPQQYDPGLYSLETSRGSVGSASAWAGFQYLGKNGFRELSYQLRSKQYYLRNQLDSIQEFAQCNRNEEIYSTIMRLYPLGVDGEATYAQEFTDVAFYDQFKANNALQKDIQQYMYGQMRVPTNTGEWLQSPHPTLTTGFRGTAYNPDRDLPEPSDPGTPMEGVFAIKSFMNSPWVEDVHADRMIMMIQLARDEVTLARIEENLSWAGVDALVPGELPYGHDVHNNIILAEHIPNRFLAPPDYDLDADPNLEAYAGQVTAHKEQLLAALAELDYGLDDNGDDDDDDDDD